jgi:Fe2+ transport system protein B
MSKTIHSALLAAVLTIPVVAFAQQSNTGLTRAEVRAELVQLEKAGYQPSHVSPHYPADIEAAMARLQANNSATQIAAAMPPRTDASGTATGSAKAAD